MRRVLTILLLLVTLSAGATTYYVKTGGNDGLAGTSDATAWATITKVNGSSFSAGDSILFRRGDTFRGQLIVPSSGSAGSHIVFDAYGTGAKPKLFGAKDLSATGDWEVHSGNVWKTTAVAGSTSAYVSNYDVANLVFDADTYCGVRVAALVNVDGQGDWFFNVADSLIYLYSASNPGTFYDNIEAAGCHGETVIKIGSTRHHVTIRNFDTRYSGNWCIYADRSYNVTVEHCDVSWVGGWIAYSNVRQGNGIGCWLSPTSTHDIIIRYNRISWCYDAGISPQASSVAFNAYNILMHDNIIENCHYSYETWTTSDDIMSNVVFTNNTCLNAGYSWSYDQRPDGGNESDVMIWTTDGTHTGVKIVNNIFVGSRTKALYIKEETAYSGLIMDHNLYNCGVVAMTAAGTFTTLANWRTQSSQEANSVSSDPLFVDTVNYHLQVTSPAKDEGTPAGSTQDIHGTQRGYLPDIGAYEIEDIRVGTIGGKAVVGTSQIYTIRK